MRMRGNDATTSELMAGVCVDIHRICGTDRAASIERGQVMSEFDLNHSCECIYCCPNGHCECQDCNEPCPQDCLDELGDE